jgi:hypothetical protein
MNCLQNTDLVQSVVGILSIILAIIALFVSWRTEVRASDRFHLDQELNKKIAVINVKPILSVWTTEYLDLKGIDLINCGTGTAVITEISFIKGTQSEKNIAKLFNLGNKVIWDTFWTFSNTKYYIKAGQEIKLVKLSFDQLLRQKFTQQEAIQILEKWQLELEGIKILIKYCDVFDNPQDTYERTLHS